MQVYYKYYCLLPVTKGSDHQELLLLLCLFVDRKFTGVDEVDVDRQSTGVQADWVEE